MRDCLIKVNVKQKYHTNFMKSKRKFIHKVSGFRSGNLARCPGATEMQASFYELYNALY